MNTALFYSTEATGLPLWSQPSDHLDQPHIVQIAAMLVDLDTKEVRASLDVIVRPGDWSIPAEASTIHKIDTELAEALGVGENVALNLFFDLWFNTSLRVAHNESFHARIVRIALKRYFPGVAVSATDTRSLIDIWSAGAAECTARLAKPFCPIEGSKRAPNILEACREFFGPSYRVEHTAGDQARASMELYFAIQIATKGAPTPA